MSRDPDVAEIIAALVGVWRGEGEGGYPTLEPFRYREVTEIVERYDHPALRFDQRTWKLANGDEVVSHWETGLLRISSDGTVLLHNAQPGRTETMSGSWEKEGIGWVMSLRSTGFAGDGRVTHSTRTLRITPGELAYEMQMETTSNPEMTVHLQARLSRTDTG